MGLTPLCWGGVTWSTSLTDITRRCLERHMYFICMDANHTGLPQCLPCPAGRKGPAAAAALAVPAPAAPDGALQVSQFTVDPAEAVVKPGCKQQVSVVFRAEANRAWSTTLGLDISERDPRDQPDGIPYELGGDSCIPGEPPMLPGFSPGHNSAGYSRLLHSSFGCP
jgi:hydrocephalus-inducing protein